MAMPSRSTTHDRFNATSISSLSTPYVPEVLYTVDGTTFMVPIETDGNTRLAIGPIERPPSNTRNSEHSVPTAEELRSWAAARHRINQAAENNSPHARTPSQSENEDEMTNDEHAEIDRSQYIHNLAHASMERTQREMDRLKQPTELDNLLDQLEEQVQTFITNAQLRASEQEDNFSTAPRQPFDAEDTPVEKCDICLDPIVRGSEALVALPCGHRFVSIFLSSFYPFLCCLATRLGSFRLLDELKLILKSTEGMRCLSIWVDEGKTCPQCRRDPFEGRPDGVISDSDDATPFFGNMTMPLGGDIFGPAGEVTPNIVDVEAATQAVPTSVGLNTVDSGNHTHNAPAPDSSEHNEADTSPEALLDQLEVILNRRRDLLGQRLLILNESHDTLLEQQRAWDDRHSRLHDELGTTSDIIEDLHNRCRNLREQREQLTQRNNGGRMQGQANTDALNEEGKAEEEAAESAASTAPSAAAEQPRPSSAWSLLSNLVGFR